MDEGDGAVKTSIDGQISAAQRLETHLSKNCHAIGRSMGLRPQEADYLLIQFRACVASLEFLRNNRDLIRDAVRIAKELDAEAPRE